MSASAKKKKRGKKSRKSKSTRATIGDCHCGNNAGACAFVVGWKSSL